MTTEMNNAVLDAFTWRRAVKVFDTTKRVSEAGLMTILEAGRLAPSSIGIEAWKFLVVEDQGLRGKLREAAYGQAQVTDASHLVVLTRRTDAENIASELVARTAMAQGKFPSDLDGLSKMATGGVMGKPEGAVRDGWLAAQTYIPLGMMMAAASMMSIDNAGMEGFDHAQVDEILGLKEKNLASVTFMVLGYRGDDEWSKRPKVRRSIEEVVERI